MGVWDVISNMFGPSNFKAITENLWLTIDKQEKRISMLEQENKEQAKEIAKLAEGERECHKLIIPLKEQNLLLKTENDFLKKLKP